MVLAEEDDLGIPISFTREQWGQILAAIDRGHRVDGPRNVVQLTVIEDAIGAVLRQGAADAEAEVGVGD